MEIIAGMAPSGICRHGASVTRVDFATRYWRVSISYRRALYLQRFFQVRRLPPSKSSIQSLYFLRLTLYYTFLPQKTLQNHDAATTAHTFRKSIFL